MTTTFALLCERCGLSVREAAEFLDTRLDTVKSWSSGRREAPPGAIDELRGLYAHIERAAAEGLAMIRRPRPGTLPQLVELGLASDDAEARALGWPCIGAHAAVLGLVAARATLPIEIVPRGATLATAAAADRHDKMRDG
jgi:hypothetical protein